MAVNLNLLPKEYSGTSTLNKAESAVKRLTLILLPVLLIFVTGLIAFYVVVSNQVSSAKLRLENLKNQVRSQETTEQKLVLVKDRLSKVKSARGSVSASTKISPAENILALVPADAVLSELSFDPSKTQISVTFKNSTSFVQFFEGLKNLSFYKFIKMTSFGFNPTSGYLVSLEFI